MKAGCRTTRTSLRKSLVWLVVVSMGTRKDARRTRSHRVITRVTCSRHRNARWNLTACNVKAIWTNTLGKKSHSTSISWYTAQTVITIAWLGRFTTEVRFRRTPGRFTTSFTRIKMGRIERVRIRRREVDRTVDTSSRSSGGIKNRTGRIPGRLLTRG